MARSIYGRGGNDSLGITVAFDSSTAYGGEGNDTIWLSRGASNVVYGDAGNDSLEIKMGLTNSSVSVATNEATSTDGNDSIVLSSSVFQQLCSRQRWQRHHVCRQLRLRRQQHLWRSGC